MNKVNLKSLSTVLYLIVGIDTKNMNVQLLHTSQLTRLTIHLPENRLKNYNNTVTP